MKGKERNSAFFSNQKVKPSVSLHNRFKSARAQGCLNMSSSMPPLTEIPIEVFDLEKYIEEGEKFWEFEPLKSLDMSFNKITTIPSDISNLIDCISMKFRDNLINEIPSSFYEGCINIKHLDMSLNKITNINERINNLTYLKDLLLSNNLLQSIPNELVYCSNIINLDLDHNQIQYLPECEWKMNNLLVLNISYNMLTTLPSSISNIKTLEILNCSHNNLSILPDLGQLDSLRILDASQNKIREFPNLSRSSSSTSSNKKKSKLTHLILNYNYITTININILIQQTELIELLIHNNQLSELPIEIEYLQNLKIIDISNNNLRDIPANLGYMTQLQHIKADGNPIKVIRQHILMKSTNELKKYLCTRGVSLLQALPMEILSDKAMAVSLQSQITTDSKISSIDQGMIGYNESHDNIQKYTTSSSTKKSNTTTSSSSNTTPSTVGFNQATIAAVKSQLSDQVDFRIRDMTGTVLDMSLLSLPALPIDFIEKVLLVPLGSTLITLNLSNNNLSSLPVELLSLSSLRILNLAGNKLGTPKGEVIGIDSLPHISSIDISKNDLTHQTLQLLLAGGGHANNSKRETSRLTEIIMNNNPLRRLPIELSRHSGLKTLRMCYCQLSSLDDIDFTVLFSLVTLDVSNNKIASIPGSLLSSTTLEYLSIENNELKEVPIELGGMIKLKSLLVAGNPQRTVRTNILQQGSSKVIEWLRSRLPVSTSSSTATSTTIPAASTPTTTTVNNRNMYLPTGSNHDSHYQDSGYDYSDPLRQQQQQQQYDTAALTTSNNRNSRSELPQKQQLQRQSSGISRRRVPTQPPPPFATAVSSSISSSTTPPPAATTREDYVTMKAEMQYVTESSAYRAHGNDHYSVRQPQNQYAVNSYSNTREQAGSGRPDPRYMRQDTAFVPAVAPITSRYARAGAAAGGSSSMGALLGGGSSEQGNSSSQARRGQQQSRW